MFSLVLLQHFAYWSYSVPGHCTAGHETLWKGLEFCISKYVYILYGTIVIFQVIIPCFLTQALVIDGKLQSAEIDEFIYHESLVHPALLHHPKYF